MGVGTEYVGKGNFVRVHDTKTHRGRRFVVLLIPNPSANWRYGHHHAPAEVPRRRIPSTYWIEEWVGPRAALDDLKRKSSALSITETILQAHGFTGQQLLHAVSRNLAIMWIGTRSSLHCADKRVSWWVCMSRYTVKTYYAGVLHCNIILLLF